MSYFKCYVATPAILSALFFLPGYAAAQATITIINNDAAGEGFNDTTSVSPVAGNTGTTLGEQRLNAFQAAASDWGNVISSSVEIKVDAALDPLIPCNASGGVLGRAGTQQIYRNFTDAPQTNTWFSEALANSISNIDNDTSVEDIQARFNSSIDNNNDCLNETNWFYGIGVPTPANTISFFETVKHELAHGLGVQSFVDVVTTGAFSGGMTDVFTNNLHDHSTGEQWSGMTNTERLASATDTGDLHWTGPRVNACGDLILTEGMSGGHVRMFAPSPVQGGSSVSHFDTALTPDELMEPFATDTSDQRLTDRLLADIGWDVTTPTCDPAHFPVGSFHFPIGSGHFPAGSSHFPIGSFHIPVGSVLHNPIWSGHSPAGSFHLPVGSVLHQPIGSAHFPIGSFHQPVGSFRHGPITSPGHNQIISNPHNQVSSRFGTFDPAGPVINPANPWVDPRFDPRANPGFDPRIPVQPFGNNSPGIQHSPQVSLQHNPIVSNGHNPAISQGHNPFVSQGHNPFVSQGHNPFVSQGHNPFVSQGHNPFVSQGHNPIVSQGHNPLVSQGHNPLVSQGHNPFVSQGHNPLVSQGHNPLVSQEHNSFVSQGHNPLVSQGHNLLLSQGHSRITSLGHNSVLSQGHDPIVSVGHNTTVSQAIPTNPIDPIAKDAIPQGQGTDPGLEHVPGNRSSSLIAPIPYGRPYTVPTE